MKYSLRSLLIIATLSPPLLAAGYFAVRWVISDERAQMVAILIGVAIVWAILKPILAPDPRQD